MGVNSYTLTAGRLLLLLNTCNTVGDTGNLLNSAAAAYCFFLNQTIKEKRGKKWAQRNNYICQPHGSVLCTI